MDLKSKNQQFIDRLENDSALKAKRDELVKGQHPETLVITCSDSRVVPEMIFNCSLGELFVIRTIGNVINEGELASVEYAIEHLECKLVMVMGHTACGAISAAIDKDHTGYIGSITKEIKKAIGNEMNPTLATKLNVNNTIKKIMESEVVRKEINNGVK